MAQHILPSIFDRLFHPVSDSENRRHVAGARLCEAVRRDLECLLNTRGAAIPKNSPCARGSVAGYGVDALSPQQLATADGQRQLMQQLSASIARFEPRLGNVTISTSDARSPQRLRFRIDATLQINSEPERISFDSVLEPATATMRITRAAT